MFPLCFVALCASKARHRLGSESVSWCLETSLFLRLPSWDGAQSLPLLSLFFVFYIFSYLLSKTMGCFSGCLMSSASIQKLFLWILFSVWMFFWWICGGESGLPVLFLCHLRTVMMIFDRCDMTPQNSFDLFAIVYQIVRLSIFFLCAFWPSLGLVWINVYS